MTNQGTETTNIMASTYDLTKYKKLAIGGSVTSLIAGVFYEYYRLKWTLNSMVNTDVLDIDKKRPDYIYIKYSIYRESMAQLKYKQEYDKNWINVIIHPFGKWWKSIKHSIAWRLLEISRSGDHHDRLKAVRQLSRIDHLKDWDYQHLAQICDARTAISLARHQCDGRWFIPPRAHGAVRQPKSIIAEIRKQIDLLKPCKCIDHFNGAALNKFAILKGYEDDPTYLPIRRCRITKQEYEFLKQCMEVMFHLTRDAESAKTLIKDGFLQTLMEVQKLFYYNNEMRFLLAKVMANLSLCKDATYDFFATGWVGVLADWSQDPELRVQVTAAKALINMDADDTNDFKYQPRLYPLYPKTRMQQKAAVDIVFVHGLLGGVFVTWRQKDREEPQLGLYGKNAFYYTKEGEDDIFMIEEFNKNGSRAERRRVNGNGAVTNNKKASKTGSDSVPGNMKVASKESNNVRAANQSDTLIYTEYPLISKTSPTHNKPKSVLSDIATNELIATLQTADEMSPDWEIVFPDCPVHAQEESQGPFSISGEEWINDDTNDEYTYCWPMDWLPNDYPNIRVLGLNYETSLSEWSSNKNNNCPCEKKGTLHNRSEEFLKCLVASGVGRNGRPVIWVGHSMGGLIAKSIIIQALESDDANTRQLAENTKGLLFLGTPHKGSPVAKLKQHIQLIFSPTIEVKELEENNTYLLRLHEKFLKYIDTAKERIEVVSVAEGCPTVLTAFKFPFHIVSEESAQLHFGDFYVLNVDHLGLSKPVFRQSFLYQRLLAIIRDVMSNSDENVAKNKQVEVDPLDLSIPSEMDHL